jgi:hypothetical protein
MVSSKVLVITLRSPLQEVEDSAAAHREGARSLCFQRRAASIFQNITVSDREHISRNLGPRADFKAAGIWKVAPQLLGRMVN